MKILVLDTMLHVKMLAQHWTLAGAEVVSLFIPVVNLRQNPALQCVMAARIRDTIAREAPDFVLDINGACVLPLDASLRQWTTECGETPWVVWWWDAPHYVATAAYHTPEMLPLWRRALSYAHVTHGSWDAVLAREYTTWFGRPWLWLPTATHPNVFHPDAAAHSSRRFPAVELCFLGGYYEANRAVLPEAPAIARERLEHPEKTYLELADMPGTPWPDFSAVVRRARSDENGVFDPELLRWKSDIDHATGLERRCKTLDALIERFPSHRIVGKGWPDRFQAEPARITQPEILVACYRQAGFNLEPGNHQGFTGTAMRCYEIMASGSVLAHRGLPDFDPTGSLKNSVYLSFSSADDLAAQWQTYRDMPFLRTLGDNARRYTLEHHTWANRLDTIMEWRSGRSTPGAPP